MVVSREIVKKPTGNVTIFAFDERPSSLKNLQQEFALPEDRVLSPVLHKDDKVNVTLFGFSAGQEFFAHSAPTPAILYFLEGEAEVQLGEDKVSAKAGSFVHMPPMLPHGILAKSPVKMLLV